MTAPMADEVLALADGRLLAWAEWGDPRGVPLIFFHPSPGSRMLCPDPAATTAAGVRLITIDRPGYGRSDPVADPMLAAFAEDVERLLDHLWLGQVPVVGWGEGGQCAAACAAALADRISALALGATPAPDGEVRGLASPLQRLDELAKQDPTRALAAAVEWAGPMAGAPERAGVGWDSPADVAVRSRPEVEQALMAMWAEAFRAGPAGLAADIVAACRPEEYALAAVRASLFYGQDDPVIDPAHGRWWAQALPRAQLRICPDSGHLVPFVAWADILTAVVQSPSKEGND